MGGGHASGKLLAVPAITVPPGFKTATKQLLAHPDVEKHHRRAMANATDPRPYFSDKPRIGLIIGTLSNTQPVAEIKLLLYLGWIFLEKLFHGFVDVFLFLLRLCFWIQGLGSCPPPNQLLCSRVVHAQIQLSDVYSRR